MDSRFIKTARAVEPIMEMLKARGISYPSITIFADGSGHLTVLVDDKTHAREMLRDHGVAIGGGYRDNDNKEEWCFELELELFADFHENHCPHCRKAI
jgi:hypothetical protein